MARLNVIVCKDSRVCLGIVFSCGPTYSFLLSVCSCSLWTRPLLWVLLLGEDSADSQEEMPESISREDLLVPLCLNPD